MTLLRERMAEDLRIRNYSPRTVECYVAMVARFAREFGKPPGQLGTSEIRAFQVRLIESKVSWSQFNQAVCARNCSATCTASQRCFEGRRRQLPSEGQIADNALDGDLRALGFGGLAQPSPPSAGREGRDLGGRDRRDLAEGVGEVEERVDAVLAA